MKRLLVLCGLAALLVVPTAAAKASTSPTVTASTSPIVLDVGFVWSGCGYTPGQELRLQTSGETSTGEYEFVDADGCFVSSVWVIPSLYYGPGTETATVYKVTATGGKYHDVVVAISVPVVS